MRIRLWAASALCLIVLSGCLAASTQPPAGSKPAGGSIVAPTLPSPQLTVPATPPPAPTESVTATSQPPSTQHPFSTTLQIPQIDGTSRTLTADGLLYLPQDYGRDTQRRWPLIVFLHGSDERGTDPQDLTSIGLPMVLADRSDLPFVVVSPQLPPGEDWNDKGDLITALVDELETQYAIDAQRIYLTGFSLGGFGTWALGLRSPDRFAALAPVAGGWEFGSDAVPANICDLATKPIWVWHGAQDETVKPAQAEVLVNALRACGNDVRYTLLPAATHAASGVLPYRDSELYDWLLQQALPEEPPATATPETPIVVDAPIDPPAPEIANTPLPGDGSLQPIGQHAYTINLDIAGANGLTRTATMSYLLYLPRAYGQDPAQTWPLILFLHGSAENGSDPELVAENGLPLLLTGDADYPFIVVSPQAQGESDWNSQLRLLMALVDHVQAHYAVDVNRTYLTGLSMGGIGAWDLALNYHQRFAAVVPIAGGWIFGSDAIPKGICDLKDTPIWVFHGAQDLNIFPRQSERLVDALHACGSDVKFTLYPDADHAGAWTRAYADPELYAWLLAQHLP